MESQSLRTTGLTPPLQRVALVYMGKSSTGKERATHAHGGASPTSHSSAAVLKSYVSGPNRERSLRLCQGCLTSRLGRTGRPWDCCQLLAMQPCSHSELAEQGPATAIRNTTLDDPRLLHFSSNMAASYPAV